MMEILAPTGYDRPLASASTCLYLTSRAKMGEKLAQSPLVEALCEVKFAPSAAWRGEATAKAFGDLVRDEYPDGETGEHVDYSLAEGEGGAPKVAERRRSQWRFARPDGRVVVQVADILFAINHVKPYDRWETFRDAIVKTLTAYVELAKPAAVERVALRYINHLRVPERARVRDYICVGPKPPAAAEHRLMRHFYQRYDFIVGDAVLVHQTAIAKIEDVPGVVLDLEFFQATPRVAIDLLPGWLDEAHAQIGDVFRTSLNSDYYELLKRGDL